METITLKKGDETRTFSLVGNKAITAVIDDAGDLVFNPTLEKMYSLGWENYTPEPTPEPTDEEKYEERWVRYKRERYSIDKELDLLRIRADKTDEADLTEYYEYSSYVEECQNKARNELGM